MRKYSGSEKRKHPRVDANFVISYRLKKETDNFDLSQSRNVSEGGMLLTTNREFEKGTYLVMNIRFPFLAHRIEVLGEVVSSKVIAKNLIYNTRIKFFGLKEALTKELEGFVSKYISEKFGG